MYVCRCQRAKYITLGVVWSNASTNFRVETAQQRKRIKSIRKNAQKGDATDVVTHKSAEIHTCKPLALLVGTTLKQQQQQQQGQASDSNVIDQVVYMLPLNEPLDNNTDLYAKHRKFVLDLVFRGICTASTGESQPNKHTHTPSNFKVLCFDLKQVLVVLMRFYNENINNISSGLYGGAHSVVFAVQLAAWLWCVCVCVCVCLSVCV